MHTLRAITILSTALSLCAGASAQGADELGAPAPAPSAAYAQPFNGAQNLAVLYDNGPWITGVGNGAGGADTSEIEGGFNTFGYGTQQTIPIRIADDFVVPTGETWNLTSMTWRGYQTGSTTAGSITAATVQIWNGAPGTMGATVVAGDTTTNRLTGQVWSGVYRVTATTLTNSQRPVMDIAIDMSWAPALATGTYWVDVGLAGSLASGPWSNPTVPSSPTDNGRQFQTATGWVQIADGTSGQPQDFPFVLEGTGGGCPPPTTYCTPKTSSNGCVPMIGFAGSNSLSAGSAAVIGTQIEGAQLGVVFWGTSGMTSQPFQGGFLCVAPPVFRLGVQGSGGTLNTCTGTYNQSVNNVLTNVGVGNTAWFQIWFRDPGSPSGTGLSNGLEVTVCP